MTDLIGVAYSCFDRFLSQGSTAHPRRGKYKDVHSVVDQSRRRWCRRVGWLCDACLSHLAMRMLTAPLSLTLLTVNGVRSRRPSRTSTSGRRCPRRVDRAVVATAEKSVQVHGNPLRVRQIANGALGEHHPANRRTVGGVPRFVAPLTSFPGCSVRASCSE
jgi:hypothetical protein